MGQIKVKVGPLRSSQDVLGVCGSRNPIGNSGDQCGNGVTNVPS